MKKLLLTIVSAFLFSIQMIIGTVPVGLKNNVKMMSVYR